MQLEVKVEDHLYISADLNLTKIKLQSQALFSGLKNFYVQQGKSWLGSQHNFIAYKHWTTLWQVVASIFFKRNVMYTNRR